MTDLTRSQLIRLTKCQLIDIILNNENKPHTVNIFGLDVEWCEDSHNSCSYCALKNKCCYRARVNGSLEQMVKRPCNGFGIGERGYEEYGYFKEIY